MKKIILIIISIMFLPILVKADMGAPAVITYKASISNPEGAKYYSGKYENGSYKLVEKGTLEFGKEIEIHYEKEIDNFKYGSFDKNYYVDLNNVTAIDDTIDLNDEEIYKISSDDPHYNKSGIVLSNDGLKMYNGPAYGYKENGTIIPAKTTINFSHVFAGEGESAWYYTEYNGVTGWVCILNGTVGFILSSEEFITSNDEVITNVIIESPLVNNKKYDKLDTIKANTIIKSDKLYGLDAWSRGNYYISYNNVSGYISNYKLVPKCSSECNITIQEEYNSLYENFDIREIGTTESKNTSTSKIIDTIPTNTKVTLLYLVGGDYNENFIGYVEYEGKKGWIEVPQSYYYELNSDSEPTITTKKTLLKEESKKEYDKKVLLIVCIISAVVLSVTAIVIVVLVNKKKNKVEVENK